MLAPTIPIAVAIAAFSFLRYEPTSSATDDPTPPLANYASIPDARDCVGIFSIGLDGNYYWHGCSTNACQPDYGDCRRENLDDGRWTCTCEQGNPGSPYCQVAAAVDPSSNLVGGFECLTQGCATAPCESLTIEPSSLFYPCVCP